MAKQISSLAAILIGIGMFFMSTGTFLNGHQEWPKLLTPEGVGHFLWMVGSFIVTVIGAIKYQLPRKPNEHTDRLTDIVVNSDLEKRCADE